MDTGTESSKPPMPGASEMGANAGWRPGTVLWDRYEVVAALGESPLGKLWQCEDQITGLPLVVRWLPPDIRRSRSLTAAIHAGIRRISDHSHANVAAIRQLVYVGAEAYLVGDFAPGQTLNEWIRSGPGGRRTLEEALPVLKQVAAALDFSHEHRMAHGNLKPTNVLRNANGVVKVTDFGLVPHHHVGLVRGSVVRSSSTGAYRAPELGRGISPDSASDQYSLAVLAVEILTGESRPPSTWGSLDVSHAVQSVLRRAASSRPRKRFVTCDDFIRALGGERVGGRRKRSPAEWRRLGWWLGGTLAVLGTALGLWFGGQALLELLNRPVVVTEREAPARVERKTATPQTITRRTVTPLKATTPLPEEGKPWVAHTVPMEFVWVFDLQMWVGRFEVSNDEYHRMNPDHSSGEYEGVTLNNGRQPVVRVNFTDTKLYAEWLTAQESAAGKLKPGWAYRLPTRMEAILYTRAGQGPVDYPWGTDWPPLRGNYADSSLHHEFPALPVIEDYSDGFPVTAPVQESGENAWGLFGAGGNVWETTIRSAQTNTFAGWQGGGWDDHAPTRLRIDTTYGFVGNARGAVNGFRLVLAPVEAPPAETDPLPETP